METGKFVRPYVEHGSKAGAVRKITVSIPLHILRLLSDERTRRQVNNLRHATNSDLLVEAFLHAFTGQPLPTDEELKRTMATAKKATAKKSAAKKATKKSTVKKTAARKSPAKKASTRKVAVKKAATRKSPAKKATAKKAAVKKVARKASTRKVAKAPRAAKAK
jgi:transcriptional regulator of met regulon